VNSQWLMPANFFIQYIATMPFSQRSYQQELLDGTDIPFEDIQKNMQELATINTWLGGHRITLKGCRKLIKNSTTVSVCEIGCGGGDNLYRIYQWAVKNDIQVHLIGVDINPHCIAVAQQKLSGTHCSFIVADYKTVLWLNKKPDIIFSSLFCHHFNNNALVSMLQWMKENTKIGFFINDLHRQPLAYYSIKVLTQLFSSSYLVQHDAPLSVKRSFRKRDWKELFLTANLPGYTIQWKWAFRWLVIYQHGI
jgi:SAM-dependent methyltransferase